MKRFLTGKWNFGTTPRAGSDEKAGTRPARLGLLVFENESLTATVPLGSSPTSIGRDPSCAVRLSTNEISRMHCSVQLVDAAVVVTDLGSTNGTFRFGQRVTREVLRLGDEITIGRALVKLVDLDSSAWSVHTGLYEEMYVDGLTRLPNRRGFRARLDGCLPALPNGTPVGLLLISIDQINHIGNSAGTLAQSAVIFHAARLIKSAAPSGSIIARLGLGEFGLFCYALTKEQTFVLREELCSNARSVGSKDASKVSLSFSIGVADARVPLRSMGALFCAAEDSLFHACSHGSSRFSRTP